MTKRHIWIFLGLLVVYIILAFSLPTDPRVISRYNFSPADARLLNISIILPISAIYLTALYGFVRFNNYAKSVQDSKEGPYLRQLADGLLVLAFSLPIGSIVGSIRTYISHAQPDLAPEATIVRNYLVLLLASVAIYRIATGIHGLYGTLKKRDSSFLINFAYLGPIILASVYTWLVMVRVRDVNVTDSFYLPDWLILLTIVVPYTFAWSIGFRAAFQLYDYQRSVKGVVYKEALRNVSIGVGVLIVISILIQLLGTMSGQLNRLNLSPLLTMVYFLLILYGIGYGLVARGAKRLEKIEEV